MGCIMKVKPLNAGIVMRLVVRWVHNHLVHNGAVGAPVVCKHNHLVHDGAVGATAVVHTIIWCTAPTDVPSATCRVTFPASNLRHIFLTASHPVCHVFLHATSFSSCTQPSALQLVKWPQCEKYR